MAWIDDISIKICVKRYYKVKNKNNAAMQCETYCTVKMYCVIKNLRIRKNRCKYIFSQHYMTSFFKVKEVMTCRDYKWVIFSIFSN